MARSREQDTNVRTHASASKGSAKPCGWEMSSGPGLITYRGLAFIMGGHTVASVTLEPVIFLRNSTTRAIRCKDASCLCRGHSDLHPVDPR